MHTEHIIAKANLFIVLDYKVGVVHLKDTARCKMQARWMMDDACYLLATILVDT